MAPESRMGASGFGSCEVVVGGEETDDSCGAGDPISLTIFVSAVPLFQSSRKFKVLPPMRLPNVASHLCPSLGFLHVALVCCALNVPP